MDTHRVFQFLDERQLEDQQTALVTVCEVEGSSMRNPGTHLAVSQDGRFAGSLSGGCIENAVVAEALAAIKAESPRFVRFGAGSPYLDIRLPCGGGIDLHFSPLQDRKLVQSSCKALSDRQPFSVRLDSNGSEFVAGWNTSSFDRTTRSGVFGHWPRPRLLIVGHGAGVEALARLAQSMACEVKVFTPDERITEALRHQSIDADRLAQTSDVEVLSSDPWTAVVFLFHDHDWEIDLMRYALSLPHFYIGAMGGRQAHEARCEALAKSGIDEASISTIHAPIGLFHSSRDPQTLALSALCEIVQKYQLAQFNGQDG